MAARCNKKPDAPHEDNKQYTITFLDYDEETLSVIKVEEGSVPTYNGRELYRDPSQQYTYTFAGWVPELVPATQDATYTASYTTTLNQYTITWVVDGQEYQEKYPYGAIPEFKGSTDKEGNAEFTYTFTGWDKELSKVQSDVTYTAVYRSDINSYLVTFDTVGGSPIESQTVQYGGCPTRPATNPTKEATATSYYVFDGWNNDFATPITGPTTITAVWYETKASDPHGDDCIYIHYPVKAPTESADGYKEFWKCPVHDADAVLTRPASAHIVEASSQYEGTIASTDPRFLTYWNTVTFDSAGGSPIDSETVAYGQCVTRPADPTITPNPGEFRMFLGWDYDFSKPITEPITITASWYIANSENPHGDDCIYVHYPFLESTGTRHGYKEFWLCPVHDLYTMVDPQTAHCVEAPSAYDGEMLATDERYVSSQYDENHLSLAINSYGAGMYLVSEDEYKNFRVDYKNNGFDCNLYSDGANKLVWRIDLPRIDYSNYLSVSMNLYAPNWTTQNNLGPEADALNYHTSQDGLKDQGKLTLSMTPAGLKMHFVDIERGESVGFTNLFTDLDIINGRKSAYFYIEDLYDRYFNINNIDLSTDSSKVNVCSYNSDKTKLSVTNGDIKYISESSYEISNHGIATQDTCLVVDGNANPGAAVFTLPAFNFNLYTSQGNVSFKFGVRNKNEHMYFGSGDSKVDLGINSSESESDLSGYTNWCLVVLDGVAYVHNSFTNTNILVELTEGMRNGTENIVISGGPASIFRRYLVCDYYWSMQTEFPFVTPEKSQDVYSYKGDTSKISVINGNIKLPGSGDYNIISQGIATNETALFVEGNANPGAAVVTLPTFNFNKYMSLGNISFKFGVWNKEEHMYFGSGESKVDLGINNSESESDLSGYTNWEMVISPNGAYVHNVHENHDYNISLTTGMRNGTESIVLSGGGTSIYRRYLFCDFYVVARV